jgi:hypothetical protein
MIHPKEGLVWRIYIREILFYYYYYGKKKKKNNNKRKKEDINDTGIKRRDSISNS